MTLTSADEQVADLSRWRRVIWILLVVMLATGAFGWFVLRNGSDDPGSGVRAAHGPTQVVDGVPSGYSRDVEGAGTAAVNMSQSLAQAGQGLVDVAAVRTLVVDNPGAELAAALDNAEGRVNNGNVLNVFPTLTAVTEFTPDAAHVVTWGTGVSLSTAPIGAPSPDDPKSLRERSGTTEIDLVWSGGDWKVRDMHTFSGPTAEELATIPPDSPFAKLQPLQGYYTFYVS